MTLHEAIALVLERKKKPLPAPEILRIINDESLYQRGDGQPVPSSQIHARVKNYKTLFYKDQKKIGLCSWGSINKPDPNATRLGSDEPEKTQMFDNSDATRLSSNEPAKTQVANNSDTTRFVDTPESRGVDFQPGVLIKNRYELIKEIGRGGMGSVWQARDTQFKRLGDNIALKFILSDWVTNTEAISRFKTEALVSLKLNHPNVTNVRDIDREKGTYFLVMEYLDGQDLRELLNQKGRLELEEAENIFLDVCNALDYAHSSSYKLIHRDLKPQNILICSDGTTKVMDFGIAKILNKETMVQISSLTRSGQSLGTMEYMAPEQRKGLDTVDARADIYSLGLILYEMLTGELPVGVFEKPSEVTDGKVPKAVDAVIDQCIAQRVGKRYSSVKELKDAFLRAVGKIKSDEGSINVENLYLQACERVYLDGIVDSGERATLNEMKSIYNLTDEQAEEIEQMVRVKYPDVVELELDQEPNKTLEIHKSKIIDGNTLVESGGVIYEKNSEEPLNGIAEWHYNNGHKKLEGTYKDGRRVGLWTEWYENGQKQYEINYKDGQQNGLYKWWYENGQKKGEINYKDGQQNGLDTLWHENGRKKSEQNYKNGKKNGLWTEWYENEQKKQEMTYKDGRRVGLVIEWHKKGQKKSVENYKNGKPEGLVTYSWHKKGKKKSEQNYKNGKKNGLWTEWYENGQKQYEINYKDGQQNGLYKWWYENGQKKGEGKYKNGKEDGLVIEWHKKGKKKSEQNYKNGKKNGLWTEWYENGQKKQEMTFKDGKKEGFRIEWYENGQKKNEITFKDGKEVRSFWRSIFNG
jgi:antitoxin component YwqK of YwqJK toxin-antitoxin module